MGKAMFLVMANDSVVQHLGNNGCSKNAVLLLGKGPVCIRLYL